MIRKGIILIILALAGSGLRAQYYDTGQEPASFSWEKLESHHFTFIYPASYSDRIDRMVYSFERAYDLLKGSYKEPILNNIPVIIHNHTVQSNGYVVWAPRRIELYPLPGQDNIPMDHIEQLALHELMHVLQMHSFKRGISKTLSWVFGEQYTGALGIYTPYWFLEGEAVIAESAWSYSGRGRYPFFEKRLKAVLLDKDDIYSYDKLLFGSYRDYTPDHYQFGYQMSAWARINLEENVWQRAMDYTALRPYTLNPFNIALKKYTAHSKEDIYFETMVSLRNRWKEEEEKYERPEYRYLNPGKGKDYINYYSPVAAGKDSIIAVKTSLYDVPRFVLVDTSVGEEKRLHTPGNIWPYKINYAKGIIVWAETYNDPRWANREYSVIKRLDIESGLSQTLTKRSRLFGPDISPDGQYIVAAESTVDHKNSIVILDAVTGEILSRHASPGNRFISYPSWSDDMKEIVFISSNEKGEGIMSLDTRTGAWLTYLEEGRDDLQSVRKKGSGIFFTSSASGTDNAFLMEEDGDISRITSSRFGITDLAFSGDDIIFSDYTADGNSIAIAGTGQRYGDLSRESTIGDRPINKIDRDEKLVWDEEYTLPSNYEREKYSKAGNLFRFHSWMPFYSDINNISFSDIPVRSGAMVMTQNNLSSLISTIGYEYRDREHLLHSLISWKGWYPAVDFSMTYGGAPVIYNGSDSSKYPSELHNRFSSRTTVYVPLRFNHGRFRQTLWPSVDINYRNNYIINEDKDMFDYGQTLITSRLYFSNLHRMSYRDIWPRYGQVIDLNYSSSLFDSDLYGPVYTLRTAFYFPGIFRNHGLKLSYQAEMKEFRRLIIQNRIALPRGYNYVIAEKLNSFSLDYAFPVLYPDFHFAGLIYVNRIRNTLFADYAISNDIYDSDQGGIIEGRDYLSSAGVELLADFYLFRIPVKLSGGLQAAYLPYERSFHFGLLLNMDVFGFVLSDRRPY
ncbi:MAG: hypothetical protein V2I34_05275 [Bacteroidales bacterium]|jgi:hypothetical protein|nr:hypothetical protein [Bacteroidales bacterium]